MEQRINVGEILLYLRARKGYPVWKVCHHLCAESEISKIESGIKVPDYFLVERLVGRLGKSAEKLEYILSTREYFLHDLRYRIEDAFKVGDDEKTYELLKKYEQQKEYERPWHQQFAERIQAQLLWKKGTKVEKVLEVIQSAIGKTMSGEWQMRGKRLAFSSEEIRLLVLRWEVSCDTPYERSLEELKDMLSYINENITDEEEKVKIYPYTVFVISTFCINRGDDTGLEEFVKRSYQLLVKQGSLILLPETLDLYRTILEKQPEKWEECQKLEQYLKTILDLEKEYQIPIAGQQYGVPMMNKEFLLDYEMLYTARKAHGITAEQASEGICTPETLSRIENARRSPNDHNYGELSERLGRRSEKISTVLRVNDFDVLELKRKLERSVFYLELGKATEYLKELEDKLDFNCKENKQYILFVTVILKWSRKEISSERAVKMLEEAIRYTFIRYGEVPISEMVLTRVEVAILNNIAIIYADTQQKKKSIEIYKNILYSYKKSTVDERFHLYLVGLIMGNLASFLEETDYMEEALQVAQEKMKLGIQNGKGDSLGRTLTTIAFTKERMNDKDCFLYYENALNMLELMNHKTRCQVVKEHLQKIGYYSIISGRPKS